MLTRNRLKLALIVLGACSLAACQAVPAQVAPSTQTALKTLSVTGQGKISIPATLAQVNLGVEVQGKTAETVQKEVAARSQAVVDFLKAQKVEKLQTAGIRLNPNYDYANNQQKMVGYTGTNTVQFRIETAKAGNLLDKAVAAGATRIDSVSFVATDDAIAKAQQEAIAAATQAAKRQAEAALTSLNLQQKEIVNIAINPTTPPPVPIPYAAPENLAKDTQQAITPVEGGEQTVTAAVTLQVKY